MAYITNPTAANYAKDTKILPALKACKDLYIEEVDASQSLIDFSRYDLVVVSEIPNSSDPLMASIKTDKPILNMKVFEYKTTENTWNWATTGYGDSYTATTISVSNNMLKHPMFKDVTYNNGNEIRKNGGQCQYKSSQLYVSRTVHSAPVEKPSAPLPPYWMATSP